MTQVRGIESDYLTHRCQVSTLRVLSPFQSSLLLLGMSASSPRYKGSEILGRIKTPKPAIWRGLNMQLDKTSSITQTEACMLSSSVAAFQSPEKLSVLNNGQPVYSVCCAGTAKRTTPAQTGCSPGSNRERQDSSGPSSTQTRLNPSGGSSSLSIFFRKRTLMLGSCYCVVDCFPIL